MSSDLESIRSIVVRVTHTINAKKWTELRALYAPEVETDYTSLFGGSPQRQGADALISGWRTALEPIVTQHLLGSLSPEHVGAVLTREMHVRGDELVIQLQTSAADGTAVTRTLTWQRVG